MNPGFLNFNMAHGKEAYFTNEEQSKTIVWYEDIKKNIIQAKRSTVVAAKGRKDS